MNLQEQVPSFIDQPFPLWEIELTTQLVSAEWKSLFDFDINPKGYSTARAYCKDSKLPSSGMLKISETKSIDSIFIEYPQPDLLGAFYEETGLEILNQNEIRAINGIDKIKCALETLGKVPGVLDCIRQLVKCIGILKQHDPEIDISHSDPNIPFSIFVSVCEDTSEISNLRVAESILHEAMHLKLTLIEHHVDLIVPRTNETFYSPWRDEQRPVRGVLHGLFVFRAIFELYNFLEKKYNQPVVVKYLKNRKEDIIKEFLLCKEFCHNKGLTVDGAILTKNLLPLN